MKLLSQIATRKKATQWIFFMFLSSIAFQNCSKISVQDLGQASTKTNAMGLTPPSAQIICDPLSSGNATLNGGLVGSLTYRPDQVPSGVSFTQVSDYINFGTKSAQTVYLSQLNVPTRKFTDGFMTQDNSLIRKDHGELLIEYFGLHMETILKLSSRDPVGKYQLALLSDDGTILEVHKTSDEKMTLIRNDGAHSARFGCASSLISMSAETRLPISVDYFQGPRMHIALVAMWRQLPEGTLTAPADPLCGQDGGSNSFYFDSETSPSTPQPAYNQLLSRGWKPISSENFELPNSATNPCH